MLIYAQPEVFPDNTDAEAIYGYFDSPPTANEVQTLYDNHDNRDPRFNIVRCLGWAELDFNQTPEPNPLSEKAGLKRHRLGYLG